MLIFLCQGGESTITVYAPEGSRVTASGGGEDLGYKDVPSGGSVSFKVHTIATWSLTCTSGSLYRETTKQITSFGQSESWTVSFAYIKVHTHPSATIRATKTGFDLGPYTADPNGDYDIPIPENAIDSTAWTVRATDANSSGVYEDVSATTSSATSAPDVYPLYYTPIIRVTWTGGGSATSYGYGNNMADNGYAKITHTSRSSWKMWIKAGCTVRFIFIKTNVSFWAIGKGGNGANNGGSMAYGYWGGGGGGGGQVKTESNKSVSTSTDYTATVGNSGSSFGSIVSAGNGHNGASDSQYGGASGGGSGAGGSGNYIDDHVPQNIPASSGGAGVYAFNDSGFDGVEYGHGGGGGWRDRNEPGYTPTAPGSGGRGAGEAYGLTNGLIGIICLKNA